jgi:hypothetical protein
MPYRVGSNFWDVSSIFTIGITISQPINDFFTSGGVCDRGL